MRVGAVAPRQWSLRSRFSKRLLESGLGSSAGWCVGFKGSRVACRYERGSALSRSRRMSAVVEVRDARSGNTLGTIAVDPHGTVLELKRGFLASRTGSGSRDTSRVRLTVKQEHGSAALPDGATLHHCGVLESGVVYYKDLGPQVDWRTVYVVEYLGPLLLYPLFFFNRQQVYYESPMWTTQQWIFLVLWTGHYVKRELETLFLHKFSKGTMPLCNLFKNSAYYWIFAAFIGFTVNRPYREEQPLPLVVALALLFIVFELCNLSCHAILASLRPPGTTMKRIPRGFLFELVSCPNYFFEALCWLCFAVMTDNIPCYMFFAVGTLQMADWARKKHRQYNSLFDGLEGRELYPPHRKAMLPYIF